MTTKGVVDVVFSLDASDSMRPCIDAVKTHITGFLKGLESDLQRHWDVRFDYVAHWTAESADGGGGIVHHEESLYHHEEDNGLLGALYNRQHSEPTRFFTSDIEELRKGLGRIEVAGDEGPLIALDFCLDFPWRPAEECHRVVILLTDETFETSISPELELEYMEQVQEKIEDLRIQLFVVAPDSAGFDRLSQVDKSEYEVIEALEDGLSSVDFAELLAAIGSSVSASVPNQLSKTKEVTRGLFGQEDWGFAEPGSLEDGR